MAMQPNSEEMILRSEILKTYVLDPVGYIDELGSFVLKADEYSEERSIIDNGWYFNKRKIIEEINTF